MAENLKPRQSAVQILSRVLDDFKTLDWAIRDEKEYNSYSDSDRHFIRLLLLTTLRHLGQIDGVLAKLIKKKIPNKQKNILYILRLAVAQSVFLNVPDYAVVNTSVALVKKAHQISMAGFVNGVLRNLLRLENPLEGLENPKINLPDWMYQSWKKNYGSEKANLIAQQILNEPPLDITVKENPDKWAEKWNGRVLNTGTVRVKDKSIDELDGLTEGLWWVQNASASVPAQLFTKTDGLYMADLCAAPGGKTAQLINKNATVMAVDISQNRIKKLKENMKRLRFEKKLQVRVCDILDMTEKEVFDSVLLDVPCSATGTIARHPELKFHKTKEDILRLQKLQIQLLKKAITLVKKGGEIVYSTCSLEPEEGDMVVGHVLSEVEIIPIRDEKWKPFWTDFGSLRMLPLDGYDGFYACLLRKK